MHTHTSHTTRSHALLLLEPLGAGVALLLEDTTFFRGTVPSGCARRTPPPFEGVTEDTIVLDVIPVLVVVRMEMIPTWFAVVTDILIVGTRWESSKVTLSQHRPVICRIVPIVTQILVGVEKVKTGLLLLTLLAAPLERTEHRAAAAAVVVVAVAVGVLGVIHCRRCRRREGGGTQQDGVEVYGGRHNRGCCCLFLVHRSCYMGCDEMGKIESYRMDAAAYCYAELGCYLISVRLASLWRRGS